MSTITPAPSVPQPAVDAPVHGQKPVAVFVCHGMGQQVHFETAEAVVNALLREQGRRTASPPATMLQSMLARPPRAPQESAAEYVNLGDKALMRGTLSLGPTGNEREVHVYEGYWAPLTEGKIGVWAVIGFLLSSALLGIWNCLRNAGFDRFMFGRKIIFGLANLRQKEFSLALRPVWVAVLAVLTYSVLTLLVGPVILANAATVTSLISLPFSKDVQTWLASPLVGMGTFYIARIEAFVFLLGVAVIVLPKLYSWLRRKWLPLRIAGWLVRLGCFALAFWSLLGIAVATWSAIANFTRYALRNLSGVPPGSSQWLLPLWTEAWLREPHVWVSSALRWLSNQVSLPYPYLRLGVVWALALIFGFVVRWFLVEYAGDVAIYTSSYKVSEFDEVRDNIRKAVFEDALPLYSARTGDPKTGPPVYDQIFVVGHSLGSVIAYDTLNSLLIENNLNGDPVHVAERTKLFLTFGSPLDKVAFIFRTHSSNTHDFREKAAEQLQPLIQDYMYRPRRWVNIWSLMDIISGRLNYFDDTNGSSGGPKRVMNRMDFQAWVPFAAHTEYWRNTLFAKTLYDAILDLL